MHPKKGSYTLGSRRDARIEALKEAGHDMDQPALGHTDNELSYTEDGLSAPRDVQGKLQFLDDHLEAIRGLRRATLDEDAENDGAPHVAAELTEALHELGRLLARLQQEVKQHSSELHRVNVDVRYIVEENSALQQLVARLVERVDELGAPASEQERELEYGTPFKRAENPRSMGRDPHPGRVLSSSARPIAEPRIHPWRPGSLSGPVEKPALTRLHLESARQERRE